MSDSICPDSTQLPKPKIVDTIVLKADTLESHQPVFIAQDSLQATDSLPSTNEVMLNDTLPKPIGNDTVQPQTKKITPKRSDSAIETKVICTAADSTIRDLKNMKVYYYGQAEAKYDDITLKADYLEFDLSTNTCKARGSLDTLGKLYGTPVFTQGETTFDAEEMSYNFKTKKGVITKVWTEESEGYLHGEKIKRMADNTINIRSGGYTTCDLKDHPHFQFKFTKAKVIPDDKIVTGPIYVTIADVPLPIVLPFALIPNTKGQKSGIVMPTYGESANRGFYLENGGYYWAINEHYDLQLLGDIYTRGSWAIKPTFRYNQRYRFNGNLSLGYAVNKIGTKGAADYQESTDFKVQWSHKQDSKSHPRHSFSADVNIVSSNFNKYNATNTTEQLSNTFKSSIAYQTNFAGKVYLTLNASHSQNTLTRQVTVSLPELTLTVNRIYPFQKLDKPGKKLFFKDLNINYTLNGKNYINGVDTTLFKGFNDNFSQWASDMVNKNMQMGMKHTIPINLPIKLLKHFTWTTSATVNDYMYLSHIEKQWIHDTDTTGHLQTDTIHGFRNLVDFNVSSNITTKVYGMVNFAKGPIRAIRHVFTPTIGFTYKPNFGDPKWNIYNSYVDGEGNEQTYNMFQNAIFGTPSQTQQGLLTYNFANTIDMKVRSKSDTITGMKKVNILDALNFSGNYDITKDSLNFSYMSVSARTTLFKKLNISYSSAWDPYVTDSLGHRINRFEVVDNRRLFHKNSSAWNFSISYSLNKSEVDKWKGKLKKNKESDLMDRAKTSPNVTEGELLDIMGNPNAYVDWTTPWSVSLSYNLSYSTNLTYAAWMGIATNRVVQTLSINADISITPKWKFTCTTGWDFTNHGLSYTNVSIYRDLHCWEMRLNWIPIGTYKSWNFTINVKASALKDLKLTKKKDYRDN